MKRLFAVLFAISLLLWAGSAWAATVTATVNAGAQNAYMIGGSAWHVVGSSGDTEN